MFNLDGDNGVNVPPFSFECLDNKVIFGGIFSSGVGGELIMAVGELYSL